MMMLERFETYVYYEQYVYKKVLKKFLWLLLWTLRLPFAGQRFSSLLFCDIALIFCTFMQMDLT